MITACYKQITCMLYLFELKMAFCPTIVFYIDILARMNYIIYVAKKFSINRVADHQVRLL